MQKKVALFEEQDIRKIYKNNEWYYSISDIISFFTNSTNPSEYIKKLKVQDIKLAKIWDDICIQINMQTKDGKIRKVLSSNTQGILRIIQSIKSEKTEPIKRWLAKIGSERIEEISNPEILMNRMKRIYECKGYSPSWIEQRERMITTRHSLNEEWKNIGINKNEEYQILINEIYQSSLNISYEDYKQIKGINDNNYLKDSMTNLELALLNLSEATLVELHKKNKSRSVEELIKDIRTSGNIIKNIKTNIEKELDKEIISNENYMNLTENH